MKFKTRLQVTFIMIIVLPLVLTAIELCWIGLYLMNVHNGVPMYRIDYYAVS